MNIECTQLLNDINAHLHSQYDVIGLGDECMIVTPFLNADTAPVEIYIQQMGRGFRLSDEGEALNQLFASGLTVEGNKQLLDSIVLIADLNGVNFLNSELYTNVTANQLGEATIKLANAIQAVSYLVYKRSHRTKKMFEDTVEQLLIVNEVNYVGRYGIKGRANQHNIRFYVNSNRNVLIEPLSATTVGAARQKAKAVAYKWVDLQQVFGDTYKYAVVIDDKNLRRRNAWDDEALSALHEYSTGVFEWSTGKNNLIDMVAM